jgi:hypothetical protein
MRRLLSLTTVALLAATAIAATPASRVVAGATVATRLGPPWISIEYPANPFDRANRDAYLYVHTFHHNAAVEATVTATAEGIVGGARRSVALDLAPTSRPGTYALRRQWPAEGTWMLVITMRQGGLEDGATALVDIGAAGDVAAVRVPSTTRDGWVVPTAVTRQQIDDALRARTPTLARSR